MNEVFPKSFKKHWCACMYRGLHVPTFKSVRVCTHIHVFRGTAGAWHSLNSPSSAVVNVVQGRDMSLSFISLFRSCF